MGQTNQETVFHHADSLEFECVNELPDKIAFQIWGLLGWLSHAFNHFGSFGQFGSRGFKNNHLRSSGPLGNKGFTKYCN